MDRFSVSIKGVLEVDGKLLLRKNERHEYELLGGRLEKEDTSAEYRLVTEFCEESGIKIEVLEQREPWLYEIGLKNIIIVPFVCKALNIPETMEDEDGGTLHWIDEAKVEDIFMPQGYKDTIAGDVPHKSYSIAATSVFKLIPNYVDSDYFVEIKVKEEDEEIISLPLPHSHSPRDFIHSQLEAKYKGAQLLFDTTSIDHERDTIVLSYTIDD